MSSKSWLKILVILTLLFSMVSALPVAAQDPEPTEEPTAEPTQEATEEPTGEEPTDQPSVEPTEEATEEPSAEPTEEATEEPPVEPTEEATPEPTEEPTVEPTVEPTEEATEEPPIEPTEEPTLEPTLEPAVEDQDVEVAVADDFNIGSGTSKIAVMNVDPSGSATFSVGFYDKNISGTDDTSTLSSETAEYRAAKYYNLSVLNLAFGSGWTGSAVVSADREMFAAVDNTYSGGSFNGNDGFNGEAYEAPEASTDIFLPYATEKEGDVRFSEISIQGTASGSTTVDLTYKDQNGNTVDCGTSTPSQLTVTDNRIVTLKPEFNCAGGGGTTDNGSVRIQSQGDPVVVAFSGSWGVGGGWKTAYSGIPASKASNTLYYPNIFRRQSSNNWIQWSNLFIQNTSTSQVRVRIRMFNTGATNASMDFQVDIPGLSAKEFNTRYGSTGGDPSTGAYNALGTNFAGTAIVDKVSGPDNALVGVAHNFWGTSFFGGSTYTAFSANDGGEIVYVPFSSRKLSGSTWTQWDKVSVMNLGGSTVNVNVRYYDSNGTELLNLGTIPIQNLSVDSFNTRFGCDSGACNASAFSPLGSSFEGSVVISGPSGSQLVGIMYTLYPNRLNTFNALAK